MCPAPREDIHFDRDPMARIRHQPRNPWTRLASVLSLISQQDFYHARRILDGLRYHPALSEEIQTVYREHLAAAERGTKLSGKINIPTDYLRHPSAHLHPDFPRLHADRQPADPFPVEMPLPVIVGARNDYRFIEDAAAALSHDGPQIINRVHVISTPAPGTDTTLMLNSLCELSFSGRVDVSIFAGNELPQPHGAFDLPGGGLIETFAHPLLGDMGSRRLAHATENADMVLFLSGDVLLDPLALKRAVHMASVSDRVVQPLVSVTSTGVLNSPFRTDDLRREISGQYPFRDVRGLNMAVPATLLRQIGGVNQRFLSTYFAGCELSYRMFSVGSYFAPLTVPRLLRFRDSDEKPLGDDAALFISLCPNHVDRKTDGHFEVPKVSIYIPAYNAGKYIERAVNSVLNQDIQDIDVCIANDGSKDNTLDLLERLYQNEPRVRWVDLPNGGIGFASNQAIRLSNSLYIGQLDSDDCLKPGAVRRLMDYLDEHPEVVCCYSSCERIDADGNYVKDEYSWPEFSREKMMVTSIAHHFRMFRRQAWERTTNFREDIVNAVDYDMFLKLSEVGEFHHIDEKLYQRRWHGENTSSVNESFQTSNTHRVQTEALDRLGMRRFWDVHVPDPEAPRRITYKLRDECRMLMFWPDYSRDNPYQKMLYGKLRHEAQVVAGNIDAALMVVDRLTDPAQFTFHLHWLTFLFRDITDPVEAKARAAEFLEKLRKLHRKGARLVWTIHNHHSHDTPFRDIEIQLSKEIAGLADVLHLHAKASVEEVAAVFDLPYDKVLISPHGNYIGAYPDFVTRKEAREMLGLGLDEDVIVFTGQIRGYKGVGSLIAAFRRILADRPTARLILAGRSRSDPLEGHMLALTEAERARILFVGRFVEDGELQLFLRVADIAAYPYRKILTSGSLMLALSFGVPVVIPRVGMTEEVLDGCHAGKLYDGSTGAEGLEQALRDLLAAKDDGRLAQMAINARTLAEEMDWPAFPPSPYRSASPPIT